MQATRYAGNDVAISMDPGTANRLLLALEHLDQQHGLDPVLADLREAVKSALSTKSSGDVSGPPNSGSA